jgi:hypothetical protein
MCVCVCVCSVCVCVCVCGMYVLRKSYECFVRVSRKARKRGGTGTPHCPCAPSLPRTMRRPLFSQLTHPTGGKHIQLVFGVQYYPAHPERLVDEYTRYLFFLQLRKVGVMMLVLGLPGKSFHGRFELRCRVISNAVNHITSHHSFMHRISSRAASSACPTPRRA